MTSDQMRPRMDVKISTGRSEYGYALAMTVAYRGGGPVGWSDITLGDTRIEGVDITPTRERAGGQTEPARNQTGLKEKGSRSKCSRVEVSKRDRSSGK